MTSCLELWSIEKAITIDELLEIIAAFKATSLMTNLIYYKSTGPRGRCREQFAAWTHLTPDGAQLSDVAVAEFDWSR